MEAVPTHAPKGALGWCRSICALAGVVRASLVRRSVSFWDLVMSAKELEGPESAASLVGCEKCSTKISDLAQTCPHCGHPQPKQLADEGHPYGTCTRCKTFNLLVFYDPTAKCRGCREPLASVCAQEYHWHKLSTIYDAARMLGTMVAVCVAVAIAVVTLGVAWFTRTLHLCEALVAALFLVPVGRWVAMRVYLTTIGANEFRSAFPDAGPYKLNDLDVWAFLDRCHKNRCGPKGRR